MSKLRKGKYKKGTAAMLSAVTLFTAAVPSNVIYAKQFNSIDTMIANALYAEQVNGSNGLINSEKTEDMYLYEMTDVICKYRKEIVVILTCGTEQKTQVVQEMLQQNLIECFMQLDKELVPANFLEVLASMLLDGIYKIIIQSKTNEEIEIQLFALFQYHIRGIQAFRKIKR